MVRDRPGIEQRRLFKGWFRAVHLHFARIFQCDPDFIILRTDRNVRAEGAGLRHTPYDLVRAYFNHGEFRRETGADKRILSVRAEHGHAGTVGQGNAADFLRLAGRSRHATHKRTGRRSCPRRKTTAP
jgi:hypothetical protein